MTRSTATDPPERSPYLGQVVAVGTRHGKQHQFEPAFRVVLGARLATPPDLDTDRFGTFSGEIPRTGAALDTARAKARLAMDATGLPYGLASEASYGPLPGGWSGHDEILLFCDDVLGIEVLEGHRTLAIPGAAQRLTHHREVRRQLVEGLPGQALIVRACGTPDRITKGIQSIEGLRTAITAAVAASPDGAAVVEPDLRAHHNPSRRLILAALATSLAHRLATACPSCGTPGFGRVDTEAGLPCRLCETPTALTQREILGCPRCEHRVGRPVRDAADPADCPACNP